ncbi:uncharacterized protein LOC124925936 [Impatiens glandulifera]|uniref:uncharacterized protein LOC124925936 n=1 Tax=Impatiens glandulifera TaxID=253017 RepID=UPI001FB0E495|nr:uncharacterized protein LOC124925936 [Impatiens glandulifera]
MPPNSNNAYEEEIISLIPNPRSFSPTSDIITPNHTPYPNFNHSTSYNHIPGLHPFNDNNVNVNVNANAIVNLDGVVNTNFNVDANLYTASTFPTNQNNHNGYDNILSMLYAQEEPIRKATDFNIFHRPRSGGFQVPKISAEERKIKVDRYLKKKQERNFSKRIRYVARKTLADTRKRSEKGRFIKKEKSGEGSSDTNKDNIEFLDPNGSTSMREETTWGNH